jgi:ribosomal protein L37AE/L43A
MSSDAWKCQGCKRTFKGGPVHRTASTNTEPVYRYCDNCWAKGKR